MSTPREAVFKYRQRSLDHLKRVYAIVLSVSLGELLKDIYQTFFLQQCGLPASTWGIQIVLLLIFFTTASVFYFQEDKLLDLRYGFDPTDTVPDGSKTEMPEKWRPTSFALHFLCVMFMMMPFVLLALSAGREQLLRYGIYRFTLFYLILLEFGTSLAFVHSWVTLVQIQQGLNTREEAFASQKRSHALTMALNWLLVNGGTALLIEICFWFFPPLKQLTTSTPWHDLWFLIVFAALAMARNTLDYFGTWPFLYLNNTEFDPSEIRRRTFSRFLMRDLAEPGSVASVLQIAGPMFVFLSSIVLFFALKFPSALIPPPSFTLVISLPCPVQPANNPAALPPTTPNPKPLAPTPNLAATKPPQPGPVKPAGAHQHRQPTAVH